MVCEDTFTEKKKYECKTVEEMKCEKEFSTEYEPACFQQILDNCQNVSQDISPTLRSKQPLKLHFHICTRDAQRDCTPQCTRSLGKTTCHKVKVVTPHTICTKVPKEVCASVKKKVPYKKCHDLPKKVCEKVPQKVCK